MNDRIKEIKIDKNAKSIFFINNGIGFSQFGIADEILDLIIDLQEERKTLYKYTSEKGFELVGDEDVKD